nr:cell wall-binding repeat-containing protein [Quadrisphaera sp. RL12-1S]
MHRHPALTRLLVSAVTVTASFVGVSTVAADPAAAASSIIFERVAGADRLATAVASSKLTFPQGDADGVILVNGWRPADGLAAAGLAGANNAPILFTNKDDVPLLVLDEIKRLGTKKITLVGGTGVLGAKIPVDLRQAGLDVTRIAGADRYQTSAIVAAETIKVIEESGGQPRLAFATSGSDIDFTRTLPLASVAYELRAPILLGDRGNNPYITHSIEGGSIKTAVNTEAYRENLLRTVSTLGGSKPIELNLTADLGQQAVDLARWKTGFTNKPVSSIALLDSLRPSTADALSSAPLLGRSGASVFFAGLPSTQTYLKANASALTGAKWVIGGPASVSDLVVADAAQAATPPLVIAPPVAAPDTTPPAIVSAAVDGPRRVTVRMSRPVTAQGDALDASQFAYNPTGSVQGQVLNPIPGGAVIGPDDRTSITLTFASDLATRNTSTLTYADSDPATDTGDVITTSGVQLAPRVLTGVLDQQRPWITGARVVNARTVELTFSEAVVGSGGTTPSITPGLFGYATTSGGVRTPATGISVDPDESRKLRLLWGADTALVNATATDAVAYADATPSATAGDVVDLAGNQLADGAQRSVDDARFPSITRAQLISDVASDNTWSTTNDVLRLTFSEPVRSGANGSPTQQDVRDLLGVNGITYNGGFVLYERDPSNPTVLILTVRAQTMSSGLTRGASVPGGVTATVFNDDGNSTTAAAPGVVLE